MTGLTAILPTMLSAGLLASLLSPLPARAEEAPFEDQLFRRCISWMLSGEGGALIDNRCISEYGLPTPSLFQCASKTLGGFNSDVEREGCALIFDEQAKRARAGWVR